MSSLSFVARMANWWREHHEPVSSPFEPDTGDADEPPAGESVRHVTVIEPPPGLPPRSDLPRPELAVRNQVILRDMTQRFARATDALEEIRDGLTGLEETFEELPEVVRSQTRFLGAITDRLEAQELHLRELLTSLRDLPSSSAAQTRALQETNTLLKRSEQTLGPLTGGFHRLANTMQGLNEASDRHLVCLNTLTERHERYLKEQRNAFRRHNRLVVAILCGTGLLALGGTILAICAMLS